MPKQVTADNLTDEQCSEAHRAGLVDELTYITAIGASGAEYEDDDGETVEPDENELERARERIAAAINARRAAESKDAIGGPNSRNHVRDARRDKESK